ncbi:MAG: MarR family winged helix-turn-helix transcriptional regulator [Bacilli bacterium]|jgi:DNA-binding MarR family transcriptional regulator|nr:MarR family winged helix-turn-helix transcriptional regulator [Bacilli bacterium]
MDEKELSIDEFKKMWGKLFLMPLPKKAMVVGRGEGKIIMHLYKNRKREVSCGELSAFLQVRTGRTANALKNLERKGLIQRSVSSEDRRKTAVSLTPSGVKKAKAMDLGFKNDIDSLYAYLGEEDFRKLTDSVSKAIDWMIEIKKGDKCNVQTL